MRLFFPCRTASRQESKSRGNFDNSSRTAKGRDKPIPEAAARGEIGYGEKGEGEVCPPGEQEGRCTQLYPSILGRTQRWGELSVLWRVRRVTFSICLWFLYFGLKPVPAAPKAHHNSRYCSTKFRPAPKKSTDWDCESKSAYSEFRKPAGQARPSYLVVGYERSEYQGVWGAVAPIAGRKRGNSSECR